MPLRLFHTAAPRALLAAASFAVAYPATALAQSVPPLLADESQSTSVDQIIVVGRSDQPITVEPRGLSVSLGQTEFEAINAINTEDLMKYAPNFYVRKRYIGDANGTPGFRGTHTMQSARTLVLVDGFVVSNFLGSNHGFAPKWNIVGPGEVRQFDIVYGPYSARYTGNSIGGLVSITTNAPTGTEAYANLQAFTQPYKQYGTDESYDGYSFETGYGFLAQNGFGGRLSYRRLDNTGHNQQFSQLTPTTGTGVAVTGAIVDPDLITPTPVAGAYSPDHTVQDQLRLRLDYTSGDWTAQGLIAYWSTDSDSTDPQTYLADAAGNPVFDGRVVFNGVTYTAGTGLGLNLTNRDEYLTGVKLNGPLAGWDVNANLSRYWIDNQARASSTRTTGIANGAGTRTLGGDTGWVTLDASAEQAFGRHDVALGFNGNSYETASESFSVANWRTGAGPVLSAATDGKTSLAGVFLEDQIELGGNAVLTLGVRYDQWRAFDGSIARLVAGARVSQNYDERDDSSFSPKVSLQWEPAEGWPMQLSLATATRFPTVGELFQGRLDALGNFDPNSFDPNLRPEVSRDANFMVRHTFGNVRTTGSVFYQDVEDAIFSLQGFNQFGVVVSSYKNIDKVRQYGVELIAEATDAFIPGLDIDGNVAWIDATTVRNRADPLSEGERFPRIPEWRINGNIRYQVSETVKLSLGMRYASRPNTDLRGTQRGDTYGYVSEFLIFDARATWDINENVQASLGVDNLNNDVAWVFHPYPQRTAVVELKWKM